MDKFLFRVAVLLLILVLIFGLMGVAYRQTTNYQNLERAEETEKFRSMPAAIDFAVFGSSHGRNAFQYAPEGSSFFNFSMSSQTPEYDLRLMREFQEQIQPGALVVITVGQASPFWTDNTENFEDKQGRYYRILSPKNIVNVALGRYYLQRFSPLLGIEVSDIMDAFLRPEVLQDTITEQIEQTSLAELSIHSEQERIRQNHLSIIEPAYPQGNTVMLSAMEEMLQLCRERQWNAVLVTPPLSQAYHDCFTEEMKETAATFLQDLSETYDVPWLDYSRDEMFLQNYELFRDIDHLNLTGSALFEEKFMADVAELYAFPFSGVLLADTQ